MKRIELKNGCYKIINYYDNKENKISDIKYFNSNGEVHRLDGPAEFFYYNSNRKLLRKVKYNKIFILQPQIELEIYKINNYYNRLDGPAYIKYSLSGEIVDEFYLIRNTEYTKEGFYKQPEVIKCRNINRNLKLLNKK